MKVQKKSLKFIELKRTIPFLTVVAAMVTLGFLTHALYFLGILGVALVVILVAWGLL